MLNPLHPGTQFLQERLGIQFLLAVTNTLPPFSTISFALQPPTRKIWVTINVSWSAPRDVATGNPVNMPLVYAYVRQSMQKSWNNFIGLEAVYKTPWPLEMDLRVGDPLVVTAVNNTPQTIQYSVAIAVMEIDEEKYPLYNQLWNGLYNFEYALGELNLDDMDKLIAKIKAFELAK